LAYVRTGSFNSVNLNGITPLSGQIQFFSIDPQSETLALIVDHLVQWWLMIHGLESKDRVTKNKSDLFHSLTVI
jgi:hypothetical protein